jgi:hypothetical protein
VSSAALAVGQTALAIVNAIASGSFVALGVAAVASAARSLVA